MNNTVDFHEPIFRKERNGTYSVNANLLELFSKHGYVVVPADMYQMLIDSHVKLTAECSRENAKNESGIKKRCANCFYYESFCGVCCNGDSEMRGDFTDSEYCCDKYTNYTKAEVYKNEHEHE